MQHTHFFLSLPSYIPIVHLSHLSISANVTTKWRLYSDHISLHLSGLLSSAMVVSQAFSVFNDLDSFRRKGHVFCGIPLNRDLLDTFLKARLVL